MLRMSQVGRLVLAMVAAAMVFAAPVLAQNVTEKFTGFAINMNGAANTATIDFTITRWSTDAERTALLSLIPEEHKSAQKLVDALQDMKSVGSIRTPQTLAWDLRYARQFKLPEGGRRIVLVTDRPIGFREAANSTRSMDYPFSILEIRLNANDEGEGKIFSGSKIYVEDGEMVVENWGTQPTRFNNIKKQR
jgi:low affinity Fe/Cu permease